MQPVRSTVSHGKELCNTNSPSDSPVTVVRINSIRVRVPCFAAATIRGRGLIEEIRYHHHHAFVRLLLLLQLLLSTENLTSREVKARNSMHFCLSKKIFAFESIVAHDLI